MEAKITLTPQQINEVCEFQAKLSARDEWLFFNMAATRAIRESNAAVTFEDKYAVMQNWRRFEEPPKC